MFKKIISFIRELFDQETGPIPLHEPVFIGREKDYVLDCINSTFVSSVGKYVDRFENMIADYTGSQYAVATVNGTAALHMALFLAGVKQGDEVLTQALSFVATSNAISYLGAEPVFLDSDRKTLGLSPDALKNFIDEHCDLRTDGFTYDKRTSKRISACVPTHVLGHPVQIDRISHRHLIFNRRN